MGQLAAAEADGDLDLIPFFEKLLDLPRFEQTIVVVHVGAEPDFLENELFLALTRFTIALGLFVLEATEVQNLADGGHRGGCDFNEVEVPTQGQRNGVLQFEDPQLSTLVIDQADLARLDPVVRSKLFAYAALPLIGTTNGDFGHTLSHQDSLDQHPH